MAHWRLLPSLSSMPLSGLPRDTGLKNPLPSVETLGCANVICSDKTGTLTQNEMTVRQIYVNGKTLDVSGTGYAPEGDITHRSQNLSAGDHRAVKLVLGLGALCNNAFLKKDNTAWKVIGDPTEGTILSAAAKTGIRKEDIAKQFPLASEIPFDSDREKMSTLRDTPYGTLFVCEKGDPDVILKDCAKIYREGVVRDLTEKDIQFITQENNRMAGAALRVLGVAFKPMGQKDNSSVPAVIEKDMIFVGLLAMIDPPRREVKDAVAKCHNSGITTVMITGDHKKYTGSTGISVWFFIGLFPDTSLARRSGRLYRF